MNARAVVWVDFENTPHVLFLSPLAARLREAGYPIRCTAKPQAQTLELAAACGIDAEPVGDGDFTGFWRKVTGNVARAVLLHRWLHTVGHPHLLISSSRSASLAARFAGITGVALLDYEHAAQLVLALGNRRIWLPDLLRGAVPFSTRRIARFYEGLKENLYLDQWHIDRGESRRGLGLDHGDYVVVARPPATGAHYAAQDGEAVWLAAVRGVLAWPHARVLVTPRDSRQRMTLESTLPRDPRLTILSKVEPGPTLVGAADLVIGGGGTMNREAAVLGVPAWSTFMGPPPRIDDCLASEGRLWWVRSTEAVRDAIKRDPPQRRRGRGPFSEGIKAIVNDILTSLPDH